MTRAQKAAIDRILAVSGGAPQTMLAFAAVNVDQYQKHFGFNTPVGKELDELREAINDLWEAMQ